MLFVILYILVYHIIVFIYTFCTLSCVHRTYARRGLVPPHLPCPYLIKLFIKVGIDSLLALTGTPDPDDVDHIGIAVSTEYIEQQMISALQNAMVS